MCLANGWQGTHYDAIREQRPTVPGQTTGGKRPGSKKYGRAALRDGLSKEECQDRNLQESVLVDESGIS
ncbi:hypothetical protein DPMN_134889 [Dreissena polymorpha]|uniref:Uncharacterized protein n=1 Tax=Dreissena polymorpha TaxID=45954 RepID=A0A9D4FY51_DREPO|nr:hypothetical protein DPMN_134889 [Dreissena polymorpha]